MSQNKNRNALLGKKLGMSQVWDENGFFVPVTLVEVSTNVVTAVKNEETDGYKAVQLGYGQVDPRKVTKPMAGHFAKAGVTPRRHLAEVRTENVEDFEPGQELTAEVFPEGVQVDVTGTTKGKGFAGTIKRWGFKSYRRTQERASSRFGWRMRNAEPYSQGQAHGRSYGPCHQYRAEPHCRLLRCGERHPRHQGRHPGPEGRHRPRSFCSEGSLI